MSNSFKKSPVSVGSSLSIWRIIFSALIFCFSVVYAILGVALTFEMEGVAYPPYMIFSLVPGGLPFCFCSAKFSKVWGVAVGIAIFWMLGLEIWVGVFIG